MSYTIWIFAFLGSCAPDFTNNCGVLGIIAGDEPVVGIATMGKELVIQRAGQNHFEVYDDDVSTLKHRVTVPGMKNPWCLAACPHHKCLYIGDAGSSCIYRIDSTTSKTMQWSVGGWPIGLSTTKSHGLLVSRVSPSSILEYTTNGQVIQEINLHAHVGSPRHAIALNSHQLVGLVSVASRGHRVCIVDKTGRFVHSYPSHQGFGPGLVDIKDPRQMAGDSQGNVFVADFFNDRVVVLSPKLTWVGNVSLAAFKLDRPSALHSDELNGRLYIGEWNSGQTVVCTGMYELWAK